MNDASRRRKMRLRDAAGSFDLLEGTGEITDMVSCCDFLEIYKRDKTYRVASPEAVDPDRRTPNAPWVVSPVSDVGSAHPIVARFFIQSAEMLRVGKLRKLDDILPAITHLHSCKETLLQCDSLAEATAAKIDALVNEIQSTGLSRETSGRGYNPFPVVENLEDDCGVFLVKVNRAIRQISGIPHLCWN
ncbi:MAG: hypothetical protein OXK76_15555 [Gammaproteobacteria bacterium]|nr:hypothetical protein [Gammaproteobacteria bacterium]